MNIPGNINIGQLIETRDCRASGDGSSMSFVTWEFDGIRMGHAVSRFDGTKVSNAGNDNSVVRLHFGLRGDYRFSFRELHRSFDLIGGHHNMLFSEGFHMDVENKTNEIETFGVQFPKEMFISCAGDSSDRMNRFCEAMITGRPMIFSDEWGAISPVMEDVIRQTIDCNYSGEMKRQFLLAKALELMVLSAESFESKNQVTKLITAKADQEKIIAARDLINSRLDDPPNLPEIARKVCLNEYKLKRGFREMFDHSVFGYLTEQRLNLAKRVLQDTQRTAVEISVQLGYSTPQHFNNAFRRKFGITPMQVRDR